MKAPSIFFSLLAIFVASSAQAELLIVERSATDHAAALRLQQLHDEPGQLVQDGEANDLVRIRALARDARAERAVVFDGPTVSVIDTVGGESIARVTPDESAFTAAFVATELLTLLPARPFPPPQPSEPPLLHFSIRLGVQVWLAPPFPALPRAELGVALERVLDSRFALRTELFASPPGQSRHATITRSSSDLGARFALVYALRNVRLATSAQLGAGFTRARVEQPSSSPQRNQHLRLGIGFEPSVRLNAWLSVYALATLLGSTPRNEYRVADAVAARESALAFSLSLGLWFSPRFD